jgi:cytochrome oxidase Cu insertion factor (SCO1/SenC/PrrC family)
MKSTSLIFWATLAIVAGASYAGLAAWQRSHEREESNRQMDVKAAQAAADDEADRLRMDQPPGKAVPAFKLTDQFGKPFDSSKLLGKVWVGSSFFASCPNQCLELNRTLAGVQTNKDLDEVKFVSITCDATNDTPEILRAYAERFAASKNRWWFLTGDEDEIKKIANESFGVPLAERTHSDFAVVFDRQSRIRGQFHLADKAEVTRLETQLRKLLAEKAPAETASQQAKDGARS